MLGSPYFFFFFLCGHEVLGVRREVISPHIIVSLLRTPTPDIPWGIQLYYPTTESINIQLNPSMLMFVEHKHRKSARATYVLVCWKLENNLKIFDINQSSGPSIPATDSNSTSLNTSKSFDRLIDSIKKKMQIVIVGATCAVLFFAYRAYQTYLSIQNEQSLKSSKTCGRVPPGPAR